MAWLFSLNLVKWRKNRYGNILKLERISKIMKSKINLLSRNEQQAYLVFERDKNIIKFIEKTFQKVKSDFKLSDYKKKYGGKRLDGFWELQKKNEVFNFSLVIRRNVVRFKLKSNLDFINKFLKALERYTEFSELSPRIKAKLERRKIKLPT